MKPTKHGLKSLGRKGSSQFFGLETFKRPKAVNSVTCITDEVTALCPVTSQPDQYTVEIFYAPKDLCVESKSLKLYLHKFRNRGHFCEAFASIIAHDIQAATKAYRVNVNVTQKPRGGISIVGRAQVVTGDFGQELRPRFVPRTPQPLLRKFPKPLKKNA